MYMASHKAYGSFLWHIVDAFICGIACPSDWLREKKVDGWEKRQVNVVGTQIKKIKWYIFVICV
jgi:hypothetical protein